MNSRTVFGIIVRTLGLAALLCGLWSGAKFFLVVKWGMVFKYGLLLGIPYLAVSLYLLRGAPALMNFAYPDNDGGGTDAQY